MCVWVCCVHVRGCVSLSRMRALRHTCRYEYAISRILASREDEWANVGALAYLREWLCTMYIRGGVCMCAREDDGARVDSRNRYRPVECLGEDWTRKRRGGRITGNERGRMNRSRSCTLFPPRIRPLPSRLLSRGLRERTTARAQARCLSPPTENQYVGRSVLSPAKSQFSHSTSSRRRLIFDLTPLSWPLTHSCLRP